MSQRREDWERRFLQLESKSLDILILSKDVDFLEWVTDSGYFLTPANLVFNTLSPALTWEMYHLGEVNKARFGIPALKFGYPYLAIKKDDFCHLVPLFIWDISLFPIDKVGIKWMFKRYVHALPRVNPIIFQDPRFDEIAGLITPFITQDEINLDQSKMILKAIDPLFQKDVMIEFVPKEYQLKQQLNGFKIYNAGTLNLLNDISENKENKSYNFINQKNSLPGHPFGLHFLFPDQTSAFHFSQENTGSIISGTSGSGKKYLLKYMITNALSNGRNCLVISENNGFLADINAALAADKLEDLVLFQPKKGKFGDLLKHLAFIIQNENNSPVFAGDNFKEILSSCQQSLVKLSGAYKASRRKIFGRYDWIEVVSMFLQSARFIDNQLFNIRLQNDLFSFKTEEFEELILEISPLQNDFASINTLNHPLNILHTGIHENPDVDEISDYFYLHLNEEKNIFRIILKEYLNGLTQYADFLNISLHKEIQQIIEGIEEVIHKYQGYMDLFGNDFLFTRNLSLILYSKLSKRGKKILYARENMVELIINLNTNIENQSFWAFPKQPEGLNHSSLSEWMIYFDKLKVNALEWQKQLPEFINEEVLRASSSYVNFSDLFKSKFSDLETLMDEAIENFNAKSLFLEPLEHKALTLIKRQKWLEEVINRFDLIILNLRDFSTFYHWQSRWKGLSPAAKAITQVFSTINPTDWVMTFKNWYLHQVLLRNFNHTLPDTALPLETFEADWELLQSMMTRQIQSLWFQKRKKRIKQMRKEEKSSLQKMMSWLEKSDFSEYDYLFFLRDTFPIWCECFPVVCLTVKQANELFMHYPSFQFDHIFWGDVQYSSIQDFGKFQGLGKNVTCFYHPSFDVYGTGNELAKLLPCYRLSKIHGFYQGNPWQQWKGGEVSINSVKDASVHFHRIIGVYQSNGVNEAEASYLISELSKIRFSSSEQIPSVGIICLTETQRNFISTLIFKISKEESSLKTHFDQFLNHGLEILLPSEIASRHFNQVFLLTTFDDAQSLLNPSYSNIIIEQIASLPLNNMTVVTSIKRADLIEMDKMENNDSFISYLKFLEAIYDRDMYALAYEFQKFRPEKEVPYKDYYERFWFELKERLDTYPDAFEFRKNIFFNQDYFPFFLKKESAQSNYIFFLLDGFHAHTTHTDFIWEVRQTNKLRKYGIELLPIWTVNWWKNHGTEFKRLVSTINSMN